MKHLQFILGTIAICTCCYAKEVHGYSTRNKYSYGKNLRRYTVKTTKT